MALAPPATQARRRRGARRGPRTDPRLESPRAAEASAAATVDPAIVLAFLAPFCLEGFAGASPPWIFFNPIVLVYFMLFYGSAAILIREITRRWGKSWPTILAFGAAYGICEEGLSTKVFFDLHRTNLGPQMQYGTWAGVHWPYMFHLITAHAVFSIAVPIFLTMLLFPRRARRSRGCAGGRFPVLGAVFVGGIVFSSLVLYRRNPDHPHHVIQVTPPHYLIAIAVVLLLIVVARLLPAQIALPGRRITLPPKRLAIVGFSGMFLFWGVSYLFPAWHVPVAITMILEVLIVADRGMVHVAALGRPVLLVRARRRHAQLLRVHIVHPHGDRFVPPAGRERDGRLRIGATGAFTAGANRAR